MVDLPARLRPTAGLGVLDITEFFGETTGGVRTYLLEKARYVQRRPGASADDRRPRRARRDSRGERRPLLSPAWAVRPHAEALPVHARHAVDQPHRGARAAGPDRGRQHLVRALAGAPRDPPGRRARRVVLPQQLPARHRALARDRGQGAARRGRVRLGLRPPAGPAGAGRRSRLPTSSPASSSGPASSGSCAWGSAWTWRRFNPARRARAAETRRRHGLPEGPLAMYVGRLAAEKEVDLLLRAWPEVRRRTGAALGARRRRSGPPPAAAPRRQRPRPLGPVPAATATSWPICSPRRT